jgi:ATP-binding cassette subfamily B protein
MEGVQVRAGGHTILDNIDLDIRAGAHVAIVGSSGAGKSSLAGILLGWHRPASGHVLIDGWPLDPERLERLRRETAWVDPSVQLWNRALLDNLHYGASAAASPPLDRVIEAADLHHLLEALPEGLQTPLGEGGALVSGGEGQRVRLARGLLRPGVRLVILDEPFRGLDRQWRRALLACTRRWWPGVTLLCITHDVGETQGFDRVLVVHGGQIVEDGPPAHLAARPDSRYQALLEAEREVQQRLWSSDLWRRLRLEAARLVEVGRNGDQNG